METKETFIDILDELAFLAELWARNDLFDWETFERMIAEDITWH